MKQGGFGAFAAMDRERHLAREAAAQNGKPVPEQADDMSSTDGGALPPASRVEKAK